MDLSLPFFEIDWHELPVDYLWLDFDANQITLACSEFDDEADEYKPIILLFDTILSFGIKNLIFENVSGIGDFYDAEITNLDYEWQEAGQHSVSLTISMGISEPPASLEIVCKALSLQRKKSEPPELDFAEEGE